jgi:hypothetical protein
MRTMAGFFKLGTESIFFDSEIWKIIKKIKKIQKYKSKKIEMMIE